MPLTAAQKLVVKADILANYNSHPNNTDGAFAIAAIYNQQATPDFIVWRTSVHEHEVTRDTSPEGTNWNWSAYISRSQGERDGYARVFNSELTINPSLPNVRQAFADIFSGGGSGAPEQRAHLLAIAKRKASKIEKLLATGAGITASPATMGFEGPIRYQDIDEARNS
jgi:hypothetical protein